MTRVTRWLERPVFLALTGAVSLALVSIAASQLLLFGAVVGAIWRCRRREVSLRPWPLISWPLLAFAGWTIVAILSSRDVAQGLLETRKFFLYLILLLLPLTAQDESDPVRIYRCVFLVSVVSASAGLAQFVIHPFDLQYRISGLMSHWMTYSGLLMLVLVALSAYAVCGPGRPEWWVFPLGLLLASGIYVSQTRSVWLGAIAGATTVFLLMRPRALFPMAALLVALYLASPASIHERVRSTWDARDPETRARTDLVRTSVRLIRDNPWLGVGPKNVKQEAVRYRGRNEFADWLYQHMHNNFLQIAAERGIPGLLLWLWFMIRLGWDALEVERSARKGIAGRADPDTCGHLMVATSALGGWVAFLVAGMFEYNFGDSEVLTLFLFIMASPYVSLRLRAVAKY